MDYVFPAKIEADPDGGYLVTFPDVPEAITAGRTFAEARANASEALGLALRGLLADGRPIPTGQTATSRCTPVAVGASDAIKLAVITAFRDAGISKSELARRLGKAENEARRILDPDHPTKLSTMEMALAVLGKTVVLSVRDAA